MTVNGPPVRFEMYIHASSALTPALLLGGRDAKLSALEISHGDTPPTVVASELLDFPAGLHTHLRVCQRGWAGQPWARNPKPLTSIGWPWASSAPQIPHFYRRALGPLGPPKSLTFIDGARPP